MNAYLQGSLRGLLLLSLLAGCPAGGAVKADPVATAGAELPADQTKLLALTRDLVDQCGAAHNDGEVSALARQAVAAARKAVAQGPDQVEGHYYLAAALGYQAKTQKGDSKEIVNELLAEAKRAEQIDARFDHGGPARVLGAIYTRAPAPPLSVGDPDQAVKFLERAVQVDAAYPANPLYLAGALVAAERYDDAEKQVQRTRELMAKGGDWERYRAVWSAELRRVEARLRARG